MKKISLIRNILNLSQYDLANLLGVPRGVVNMFERKERTLPLTAMAKMATLEIAIKKYPLFAQEGDSCVNISHPFFEHRSIAGKLQLQVYQSKIAIEELKERLFQMINTYEILQCRGYVLLSCREGDHQNPDVAYEKWLEIHMMKLTDQLDLVSPEKQFMLQHRIETKLAALAVTERALAMLTGEKVNGGMGE